VFDVSMIRPVSNILGFGSENNKSKKGKLPFAILM
jgi:hypothetical protein